MSSMSAIWSYFFVSLFFAWMSDQFSKYTIESETQIWQRKEYIFFLLTAVTMSLFVGLRLWCNDTDTYLDIYEYLTPSSGSVLAINSWKLGDNPLFFVINRILKRFGVSKQNYLMFFSVFTNYTYLWFLKKYSRSFLMSVFLIWTMGTYILTAAAIKQTLAIALGLIGVDAFLEHKKVKYVVFIALGVLVHPYVGMFFIAALMLFPTWTPKTYQWIIVFAIIGVALQLLLGIIVELTASMGEEFDQDTFSGQGVNFFRLLVTWAPIILSFSIKEKLQTSRDRNNNLFMNFSMLNAEIMFVALFGTANYFARLANYFQIFQAISIPWLITKCSARNQKTISLVIVLSYFVYFVVANTIMTPFDSYFNKMPLGEYLQLQFR